MKKARKNITRVIAALVAAIMMITTFAAFTASAEVTKGGGDIWDAVVDGDIAEISGIVYDMSHMDEDGLKEFAKNEGIKIGFKVLDDFVPYGKQISGCLKPLLNLFGIEDGKGELTLSDISKDIAELRAELKKEMKAINDKMDQQTVKILNAITNSLYKKGFGEELDKLYEAAYGIGNQINVINADKKLTREQKYIEIARLIGKNSKWNTDGNPVFRLRTIGNSLAGKTFDDNRDMYQVLYDDAVDKYCFSGEVYDAIKPYIERAMAAYFYSYSVIAQCLDAHVKVKNLTDEQVNALPELAKQQYYKCATSTNVAAVEAVTINAKIYNADDPYSVISHYAAFSYKRDNDRNVFVDHGKKNIAIEKRVIEHTFPDVNNSTKDLELQKTIKDVQSRITSALRAAAISSGDLEALWDYAYKAYPDLSFPQFLTKMGINASFVKDCKYASYYFALGSEAYEHVHSYKGGYDNAYGFKTISTLLSKNERYALNNRLEELKKKRMQEYDVCSVFSDKKTPYDEEIKTIENKLICSSAAFTHERHAVLKKDRLYFSLVTYDKTVMLTLQPAKRTVAPDTAAEINRIENEKNPQISYAAYVQDIGWQNSVVSKGSDSQTAGTTGRGLRLEAFKIYLENNNGSSAVQYRAHVAKEGWQKWHSSGEIAGTAGESRAVEAVEIKLTGGFEKLFDVVYRVHAKDIGWTEWTKNGKTAGTTGQSRRIEAIEIKLIPNIKLLP